MSVKPTRQEHDAALRACASIKAKTNLSQQDREDLDWLNHLAFHFSMNDSILSDEFDKAKAAMQRAGVIS